MSYDMHNFKRVLTRKEHRCEGCFETIPAGTNAGHYKGRWMGDFYDYHMCNRCEHYIDHHMPGIADEGFTPGSIGDMRREVEIMCEGCGMRLVDNAGDYCKECVTDSAVLAGSLRKLLVNIDEIMSFYGQGLQVLNFHQNGDAEPWDNFFDNNISMEEVEEARVVLENYEKMMNGGR